MVSWKERFRECWGTCDMVTDGLALPSAILGPLSAPVVGTLMELLIEPTGFLSCAVILAVSVVLAGVALFVGVIAFRTVLMAFMYLLWQSIGRPFMHSVEWLQSRGIKTLVARRDAIVERLRTNAASAIPYRTAIIESPESVRRYRIDWIVQGQEEEVAALEIVEARLDALGAKT
jgi:hypothetical protein